MVTNSPSIKKHYLSHIGRLFNHNTKYSIQKVFDEGFFFNFLGGRSGRVNKTTMCWARGHQFNSWSRAILFAGCLPPQRDIAKTSDKEVLLKKILLTWLSTLPSDKIMQYEIIIVTITYFLKIIKNGVIECTSGYKGDPRKVYQFLLYK